jgi:hypothetical protein
MLDSYGLSYSRVPGVRLEEFDPIAQAHLNALEHLTGTGLILEDDCLPFDYREEIEVPGDFDSDNYEQTKELFLKNLMITDVMHLSSFFLNGENPSSITTNPSLERGKKKRTMVKK